MKFRRFNELGLTRFRAYLYQLKNEDPRLVPPADLLESSEFTEPLDPPIEAEPKPFATRMDFACWLHDAAKVANAELPRQDVHFWTWLSFALFDQVCPKNGNGVRQPNEIAWYIPAFDDSRRHYRHVLSGSYSIFSAYEDNPYDAILFLSNKLNKLGHFWYQIVSRQDLISNPSVIGVATHLYYDEVKQKGKTGSVSKKPGSVFRFVKLLNQLDRVWDLRLRGTDGIFELLPDEFSKFQPV